MLDSWNKNKKWSTAKELEMGQIKDYEFFIDKGMFDENKVPPCYTR